MLATILNQITALAFVVIIDVVLAGDNAIVVGLAVAGLASEQRRRAIVTGIGAATVLRILFAFVALQLLDVIGLAFAGGVLLLWVAWKLYRELRQSQDGAFGAHVGDAALPRKTMRQAVIQIVIADLSVSLDNVLAVAGVARTQAAPWVLVTGLVLSVALMGLASHLIARLVTRYPKLSWLGVAIVAVVALRMIWAGGGDVLSHAHRPL
ncbi:MAG TPA: YjbE family putative metal transport protein [Stellaceae bacterium]|nr:YjbE family putative metal transport protein [Stellaceae bacterium]